MSNDKATASFHGSVCRWGGPQTSACWDVGACGCAVIPMPAVSAPRGSLRWWERLLLAVMQGPVRRGRRRG